MLDVGRAIIGVGGGVVIMIATAAVTPSLGVASSLQTVGTDTPVVLVEEGGRGAGQSKPGGTGPGSGMGATGGPGKGSPGGTGPGSGMGATGTTPSSGTKGSGTGASGGTAPMGGGGTGSGGTGGGGR